MTAKRTLVYPVSADESPSEATVAAVARHLEANAADVEPDLQEQIDPDALDNLTGEPGVVVEFNYQECRVRVCDGTQVEVRPA